MSEALREEASQQSVQLFRRMMVAMYPRSRKEKIGNALVDGFSWAHSRFRARIHPIVTVSSKRYYIGYFSFLGYIAGGGMLYILLLPNWANFLWLGNFGMWIWMLLVSHGRNKEIRMLGSTKCYCGHKEHSHWKRILGIESLGMWSSSTRCGLCRCQMFYNRGDKQYPLLKEKELNKLWRAF